MSNFQSQSNAVNDSILIQRYSTYVLTIADAILSEDANTDHHYLRTLAMRINRKHDEARNKLAKFLLNVSISRQLITLPLTYDENNPSIQTQPTDTEIANAVNVLMSDSELLAEAAAYVAGF